MSNNSANGGRAGFSLVEITLAMLVLAVGLTAVFGLFGTGLQTNRRSSGDTRVAQFADEVFSALRAWAREEGWDNLPNASLPPVAQNTDLWSVSTRNRRIQTGDGTMVYEYGSDNIVSHALRYRLRISNYDNNVNSGLKEVRLRVWPDEYGPDHQSVDFVTYIYDY